MQGELRWQADLERTVSQAAVALGRTLYVATQPSGQAPQHGNLHAFDLTTGEPRWNHEYEFALVGGLCTQPQTGGHQALVLVSTSTSDLLRGKGEVNAFDEAGKLVWSWSGSEDSYSAPAVSQGKVFVTAGSRMLVSFSVDEAGCDEQRIPLPVRASSEAPAIVEGTAFVPCRGAELVAVELNCEIRWHFTFQGSNREWLDKSPLVAGNRVYTVSSMGTLFALEKNSGNLLWRTLVGEGSPLSAPVMAGDQLFVGAKEGLIALDAASGRINWSYATTRPVSAPAAVAGNTVYLTSEDHLLVALDAANGEEMWRHEMSRRIETPPLLVGTSLVVVDRGGSIAVFDVPEVEEAAAPTEDPTMVVAFRRKTAEEHEAEGRHAEAAALWQESGDLERAATQFEAAGSWRQAAELWFQLDRYGRRAEALKKYAESVADAQEMSDDEKAEAWEAAARAFAETGQREERQGCEREASRFRRLPILMLDVKAPEMAVEAWSRLDYTVLNEGYGVARHVNVSIKQDQFEGQAGGTQTVVTLQPGNSHSHWLDVRPLSHGDSVPLRMVVEYVDKGGKIHVLERTHNLAVAGVTASLTPTRLDQTGGFALATDELARLPEVGGRDLKDLRDTIVQYFSREELVDILFELELVEDDFDPKLSAMARELVIHLAREGRLEELIEICRERRPNVQW